MDRKIALKWARALGSGEYDQVQGALRDKNGFCCLGVLCNLHAQAHPELAAQETDPEEYLGESGSLPFPVMQWAGIRDPEGEFFDSFDRKDTVIIKTNDTVEAADSMIDLNDYHELDFKQIAAVIRKHSDKL